MTCYRIKNPETFVRSDLRKCAAFAWIAVPTTHGGRGFRRLMKRPDGVEIYGAFQLILQVASNSPEKFTLFREAPLTGSDIAELVGFRGSEEIFERALKVLSSEEIAWIETCDAPTQSRQTPIVSRSIGTTDRHTDIQNNTDRQTLTSVRDSKTSEHPTTPTAVPAAPIIKDKKTNNGETATATTPSELAHVDETGLRRGPPKAQDKELEIKPVPETPDDFRNWRYTGRALQNIGYADKDIRSILRTVRGYLRNQRREHVSDEFHFRVILTAAVTAHDRWPADGEHMAAYIVGSVTNAVEEPGKVFSPKDSTLHRAKNAFIAALEQCNNPPPALKLKLDTLLKDLFQPCAS